MLSNVTMQDVFQKANFHDSTVGLFAGTLDVISQEARVKICC
jgi:hypothetical protein